MDDIAIINSLTGLVRPLEKRGITATADYSNRPDARHGPDEFISESFVKLRAVKRGKAEKVEFSRIVAFADVRRFGASHVAENFCKDAAHALENIEVR